MQSTRISVPANGRAATFRLIVVQAMVAFCLASPARAAEEADPTRCEMTSSWGDIEGRSETVMIVRQDQRDFDNDDEVLVAFFNEDWSISETDKLGEIKVASGDGGWFSSNATAMPKGFLIWSSFEYASNVFDGTPSSMIITRNKKTIDKLSLSGNYSDWVSFKACRAKKVAVRDERRRKQKLEREIPKDPFAK